MQRCKLAWIYYCLFYNFWILGNSCTNIIFDLNFWLDTSNDKDIWLFSSDRFVYRESQGR